MRAKTEQEVFWAGDFGQGYRERNRGTVPNNVALFADILRHIPRGAISSVLELGAGDGQNLEALHILLPDADLTGVEINEQTALQIPVGEIICASALDFTLPEECEPDLVFTKGLCIHLPKDDRQIIYARMLQETGRYVLLAEYYNPAEVSIPYHGQSGKLWKMDFMAEFREVVATMAAGCSLKAYGFVSKYDPFPQDDVTWALFEVMP